MLDLMKPANRQAPLKGTITLAVHENDSKNPRLINAGDYELIYERTGDSNVQLPFRIRRNWRTFRKNICHILRWDITILTTQNIIW